MYPGTGKTDESGELRGRLEDIWLGQKDWVKQHK